MRSIILSVVIIGSLGAPQHQTLTVNEDGTYHFSYETGNEGGSHFRSESKGPDGVVTGKYSYKDPLGGLREVNYRADDSGFLASEDGEVPHPSASELPEKAAEEEEEALKAESPKKDDAKQKEEVKTSSLTEAKEEDDVDDEGKPLKLEEPIYDGPPEGFPPGFFSEQFTGLRRLPEPKKEDKSTKKKDDGKTDESSTDEAENAGQDDQETFSAVLQPEGFPPGFFLHHFTGLRRLEEHAKEPESAQNIDDNKSDDSHGTAITHGSYILPFPSFIPHLLPASSHNHPVYVYSHQQPNAYSYGYYY